VELVSGCHRPDDPTAGAAGHVGTTVVEVPGSHAIYVSQPKAVTDIIGGHKRPSQRKRREEPKNLIV
jgi:hypothetical protein